MVHVLRFSHCLPWYVLHIYYEVIDNNFICKVHTDSTINPRAIKYSSSLMPFSNSNTIASILDGKIGYNDVPVNFD